MNFSRMPRRLRVARALLGVACALGVWAGTGFTQTLFSESFDGAWTTPPTLLTGGAAWSGTTIPSDNVWHRNDYTTGWNSSSGAYTPTGAQGTSNSARFHSWDAGLNSLGSLITPALDFSSAAGDKRLSFWFYNTSGTDSLRVWLSSDDGATYPVQLAALGGTAVWTQCVVDVGTTTSATVRVQFQGKSDFGSTDYGLDQVKITVASPLGGVKTIGSGGDYPSFGSAITALNLHGVAAGGVTFSVAAGTTFTEDLSAIVSGAGTDSTHSVTFLKSGAGANPVLRPTGSSATTDAGLWLIGADWVTWNGIDIVENTGSALEYGVLIRNMSSVDGASHNTIRDCTITLNRTNTSSYALLQTSSAIIAGGITASTLAGANSYNRFLNLTITNTFSGIGLVGGTVAFPDAGNAIGVADGGAMTIGAATANDIGSGTLAGGAIYAARLDRQSGARVSGLTIRNVNSTQSSIPYGIFLDNSTPGGALAACEISNNSIFNITSTSTSTSAAILYGMRIDVATGYSASVFNNEVYNFTPPAPAAAQTAQYVRAIAVNTGGSNGAVTLAHNSVSIGSGLSGNQLNVTTTAYYQGGGTATLRNNIFANLTPSQTTSKHYALVIPSGTASASSSNLYYAPNTNGIMASASGADCATLPIFAAAISGVPPVDGAESGSANANPQFTSATSLTFTGATPAALSGTPVSGIPGITTDITGAARSLTRPTMGARETANAQDDKSAPALANVVITNGSFPVLSLTLTDNSVGTTNAPIRLWYRPFGSIDPFDPLDADVKPSGAMNGVYTWNASLAGLASGGYEFYIAARDNVAGGANVWANPMWLKRSFTGFAADDPPNFFENPASYANVRSFTKSDPLSFTLSLTATNGTIVASPNQTQYTEGSTVTLTATPATGYRFDHWTGDLSGSITPSALVMNSNKAVTAVFAQQTFALTATAGAHGAVTPSGTTTVTYGGNQTYAITPDANYHVADVLADGVSIGAVTSHTFAAVTAAHTISATFARDTFTLTTSSGAHGTVTPSGVITASYGDTLVVAITADGGYHVSDVLADGVSVGAVSAYTFAAIDANHTLSASFVGDTYDSVLVSAPAPAQCLTPAHACLTVPVTIRRNDGVAVRGYSVTLQLTQLQVCESDSASYHEGPFLQRPGAQTAFQVVNNGGGSYTIDCALLGQPCGATTQSDTLFSLDLRSTGVSGTGSVALSAVSLRDCLNTPVLATLGGPATIALDQMPVALAAIAPQTLAERATLTLVPALTLGPCATLPITWTASGLPSGATFNAQTGGVTWTPDCSAFENGPAYGPIVVIARDAGGDSARISVPVTVLDTPGVVTIAAIPDPTVAETTPLTVTPQATLSVCASGPLTWTARGLPAGAHVDSTNGVVTWTPDCRAFESGPAYGPITLVATDALGDSGAASITFHVTNTPGTLTIGAIATQTIAETAPLTVTPQASLAGCANGAISWSVSGLPTGASFTPTTGTLNWTPNCTAAASGPDYSVTVTATVASGETGNASYSIHVTHTPGMLTVNPLSDGTVAEGSTFGATASATLSGCATGPVTWSAAQLPAGATINATTGAIGWTPGCRGFEDGPTYGPIAVTATAASGETASTPLTLHVTNTPGTLTVAGLGSPSVAEQTTLQITPNATLGGCAEAPVTWTAAGLPSGASVSSSTGQIQWTPGCRGFDNGPVYGPITLTATAASGEQGSATVSITVINLPGTVTVAALANQSLRETATLSLTPVATTSGCAETPVTWSATGLPAGALLNANTGAVTWTPDCNAYENGPLYGPLVLTAHAASGETASASFSVTILSGVALAAIPSQSVAEGATLSVTPVASFPGCVPSSVTFTATGLPAGASVNGGTGTITWTPNCVAFESGPAYGPVTITATASGGESASTSFAINVTNTPGTVSVAGISARTIAEAATLTVTPNATLSGCATGPATWTASGLPTGATLNANTGVVVWTPACSASELGPLYGPVTLTARAATGETGNANFSITVTNTTGAVTVTVAASPTVAESQPLTVTPSATLPTCVSGPLSWTATGLPSGATISASSGSVTWTPGCRAFEDGPDYGPVVLQAVATSGETGSASFTFHVTNTPGTVTIAAISDPAVIETQTLTVTPVATLGGCADGALAWTATGLPAGATLSATTGVLGWVPGTSAFESGPNYPVTLTATTPTGAVGTVSFTIRVTNSMATIVAALPTKCLTPPHNCLTIPVTITRNYSTSIRGASVTVNLSSLLKLCSTPTVSITEGTFISSGGATAMNMIDNGGGMYTVDISILGSPCGSVATSGTLFSVDVTYASTSGTGTVSVSNLSLRNCTNVAQPVAAGGPTSVSIDLTPVTITQIAGQTVAEGMQVQVTPVASISACAVGPLTWTGASMPVGATLVASTGVFKWTPDYNAYDTGPAYGPVALTARAASGETATVTFQILVTNTNHSTDAGDPLLAVPARMFLGAVFPSPTSGRARIGYGLHASGPVRLAVYDIAGRLVRTLIAGPQLSGEHAVRWDGTDTAGRAAVSGLYVIRLDAEGTVARRALQVVR